MLGFLSISIAAARLQPLPSSFTRTTPSEEQLICDGLFIPLGLLLLILFLPFPVKRCVLPRTIEFLDFRVALPRQVHSELSESLAVDKKARLEPRYLFRRPVFKWMVLPKRVKQNIVCRELIPVLLILGFDLLLNQILNE